jgi:hypothetical protein
VNRWNIPNLLETEIIERDRACVYCGLKFDEAQAARRFHASWEHIINDARIVTRENIARCCIACNSSKGTKSLEQWLKSTYCQSRGITAETVAAVVRSALAEILKARDLCAKSLL